MLSIIAAIDEKRGLGKNNDLLFRIPEDFVRMKQLTSGHPIIMGRKTFESISRVLPNRTNIVITRNKELKTKDNNEGVVVVSSLSDAIEIAKKSPGKEEVFIFGGGEIFRQALALTDRLYMTIVKGDYGADTFFPEYQQIFTKIIQKEEHKDDSYQYTFLTVEK